MTDSELNAFWYMEAGDEERIKELCRVLRSAYEVRSPDETPEVEVDAQILSEIKRHAQYLRLRSRDFTDADLQAAHVHILPLFRLMGYDCRFIYDTRAMLVWVWILCYREASSRCSEAAAVKQQHPPSQQPGNAHTVEQLMADCLSLTAAYHLSHTLNEEYDLLRFDPIQDQKPPDSIYEVVQVQYHSPIYETARGKTAWKMTLFILYKVMFNSAYAERIHQYVRIPQRANQWNKHLWVLKSALYDCLPADLKAELPGTSTDFCDALGNILQPLHKGLLRWDHGNELRSRRTTWVLPAESAADLSSLDVALVFRERAVLHAEHFLCLPWTDNNATQQEGMTAEPRYDEVWSWLSGSLRFDYDEDPDDRRAYDSDTLDVAYLVKYCQDVCKHLHPLVWPEGWRISIGRFDWECDVHPPLRSQPDTDGTPRPLLYTPPHLAPLLGEVMKGLCCWLAKHNTPEWRQRLSHIYPPPAVLRKQLK